jgi:hypothetical protein
MRPAVRVERNQLAVHQRPCRQTAQHFKLRVASRIVRAFPAPKTLRGSASRQLGPLHLVSAWATAQHLSLAQVAADEGSNEIPAT